MSYRCDGCGYRTSRWMGFCPQCRSGSPMQEERSTGGSRVMHAARPVPLAEASLDEPDRVMTGIGEFDRVFGGGLVPGSAVLLGGEPGVGKSTLLLQVAAAIARGGGTALIATAEESVRQVAMRARRLRIPEDRLYLVAEADVDAIVAALADIGPDFVVVDSVQTVSTGDVDGHAGGVGQVRECGARLVAAAKAHGVPVVIVGHVTKDGGIAGPKLLEHIVDVVTYLEGDADRGVRFLRSIKNRFGAVHQVGLFEMQTAGLVPIDDTSGVFVGESEGRVPGAVLFPALDGKRPLLVEVQALVARSTSPQPRRSVKGIAPARVQQLLAVLDRHAGLDFAGQDVYVGVVGGVRLHEPAADLPVALALASSRIDHPLGVVAAWGEVGLTGEVRPTAQSDRRRREAERLQVPKIVSPEGSGPRRLSEALAGVGLLPIALSA